MNCIVQVSLIVVVESSHVKQDWVRDVWHSITNTFILPSTSQHQALFAVPRPRGGSPVEAPLFSWL
jgi:hypothetical protein